MKFSQFLIEREVKSHLNLHLEHIEDNVLNGGVNGTRDSINFLRSLRDMLSGHSEKRVNITTKFDGAPAIFAGINPDNGKFFVGTKGIFSGTPKLNYTPADIDNHYPDSGLNQKLKIALQYLPELGIKNIIQGDMMFTQGDLVADTINGEKLLTFTPNTLTYAVPADSNLATMMKQAKLGIVWHTSYHGKTFSDLKASFGINVGQLKHSKNVWFRNADFVDASGTATFTKEETAQLNAILSQAGTIFNKLSARVLNQIATNDTYKIEIKTYNNQKVRSGEKVLNTNQHVSGLISYIEQKMNKHILDSKKADTRAKRIKEKNLILNFYRNNYYQLKLIFDIQNLIVDAKHMIINKLRQVKSIGTFLRTADGFKVSHPEGFVAIDHLGKAVKLVDRLDFSHANFTVPKNW